MKLKEIRKKNNKTQQEVANALSINQQSYSRYENSINEPDIETMKKLANFFHVTMDELIGFESSKQENKIDIYDMSEEQKELIHKIKNMNQIECAKLNAYAEGLIQGRKEAEQKIKRTNEE